MVTTISNNLIANCGTAIRIRGSAADFQLTGNTIVGCGTAFNIADAPNAPDIVKAIETAIGKMSDPEKRRYWMERKKSALKGKSIDSVSSALLALAERLGVRC